MSVTARDCKDNVSRLRSYAIARNPDSVSVWLSGIGILLIGSSALLAVRNALFIRLILVETLLILPVSTNRSSMSEPNSGGIPQRFHERHQAHRTTFFSQPRSRPMGANLQLSGLRKDGTEFPVEIRLSPMQTSEGILVTGAIRDITERKLAEQQLATANERLRLAVESGSVGGWDFDLKTGKNLWFGKAHAQLGMTPDQTSRSLAEFWDRVHEDDRERLKHALRIAKDTREELAEEFRVIWRDGTTHWLRSRGRYHYAANGEPERMLGISIDITESKKAEQALQDGEQRFRLAAQTGKMYSFEWDVPTDIVVRSPERVKVLGATEPLHFKHQQFVETIHPDDRPTFIATIAGLAPGTPTGEVIYRVRGSDGGFVWVKSSGRGFFDSHGKLLRVIGMVADITDLKRAEEALAGMTRKLIDSQEQERAWIGRELHDDINQRLAMLSLELEQLRENPSEVQSRAQELQKQTDEISSDVQALSHDLHASKLEHLGVVVGIKSWCREFGERQKMEIHFKSIVPNTIPPEIGLCLFRVLQEALHNAVKHSGVRQFEVQIAEHSNEVHLTVSDAGRGFDIEAASQGTGLGLTSMRERVRLVNGTIAIDSKPMRGTTIHVRVPFASDHSSERTAR